MFAKQNSGAGLLKELAFEMQHLDFELKNKTRDTLIPDSGFTLKMSLKQPHQLYT